LFMNNIAFDHFGYNHNYPMAFEHQGFFQENKTSFLDNNWFQQTQNKNMPALFYLEWFCFLFVRCP